MSIGISPRGASGSGHRPATPLTIIGESIGEALLFVQALIEHGASQAPRTPIEGLCVSTEEALRHLVGSPPSDVVVIPTNERVRELAVAHSSVLRVVLPATGQPRVMNPLNVSPAGITSVRDFLVGEGVDSGRASQLARSPGGSVSGVLRRPLGSCASFNVVLRAEVSGQTTTDGWLTVDTLTGSGANAEGEDQRVVSDCLRSHRAGCAREPRGADKVLGANVLRLAFRKPDPPVPECVRVLDIPSHRLVMRLTFGYKRPKLAA